MAVALCFVSVKFVFLFGLVINNEISSCSFGSDRVLVTAVNKFASIDTYFTGFTTNCNVSAGLAPVFRCMPCASVYNTSPVVLWIRLPGCVPYQSRRARSLLTSYVALLLLTVEANPGPSLYISAF